MIPAAIAPFQAITISRLARSLAEEGRSIIHMEFGQPSTDAPSAAIEAVRQRLDAEPMGYWESPALKARLAQSYRDAKSLVIDPERIILTCGASPALVLALTSGFAPGDRVVLARPGYVAYRNTARALHLNPVEIACGPETRYQLTAAALAAVDPAPAAVILASPANPTGSLIPFDELRAIAAVCRARGVRCISDEIYHGLTYGEAARSMLEVLPDAFIVNSFSKYYSMPGWRLGWLVAPEDRVDRARACMGNMFLTPPALSQIAGLAAMECRAELDGHVQTYARNRERLLAALPDLSLSTIAPPDGAFYIYADIGHLTDDSLGFCEALLRDTGVATAPGVDFDPVDGRRFMRFSFAVSTSLVEDAIARMKPWFAARLESSSSAQAPGTGPRPKGA